MRLQRNPLRRMQEMPVHPDLEHKELWHSESQTSLKEKDGYTENFTKRALTATKQFRERSVSRERGYTDPEERERLRMEALRRQRSATAKAKLTKTLNDAYELKFFESALRPEDLKYEFSDTKRDTPVDRTQEDVVFEDFLRTRSRQGEQQKEMSALRTLTAPRPQTQNTENDEILQTLRQPKKSSSTRNLRRLKSRSSAGRTTPGQTPSQQQMERMKMSRSSLQKSNSFVSGTTRSSRSAVSTEDDTQLHRSKSSPQSLHQSRPFTTSTFRSQISLRPIALLEEATYYDERTIKSSSQKGNAPWQRGHFEMKYPPVADEAAVKEHLSELRRSSPISTSPVRTLIQ